MLFAEVLTHNKENVSVPNRTNYRVPRIRSCFLFVRMNKPESWHVSVSIYFGSEVFLISVCQRVKNNLKPSHFTSLHSFVVFSLWSKRNRCCGHSPLQFGGELS